MSKKKEKSDLTKSQLISIVISALVLAITIGNSLFNWELFGLASHTFAVLGIFVSSLILWLFVSIDWPSILCLISLGFLPGITYDQVYALSFGNQTFMFLFFTFIITYALEQTNFLKRLTSRSINNEWAQASPWRFITAFLLATLAISTFISPTILFMVVYPVFEEISEQFNFKKGDKNASKLLITVYSTLAIGTAMTPINHVFSITAIGIYNSAFNANITNGQYISFAAPAGLVIFIALYVSLRWIWKLDLEGVDLKNISLLSEIPDPDKKEKWIIRIFAFVIFLWLTPELLDFILPSVANFLGDAGIALPPMIGALILAVGRVDGEPIINLPSTISNGVFWPSMLIVSAALALGSVLSMEEMGVVALVENSLTPFVSTLAPILMVLVFITWAGLQTNFSSNLVTTTVVTTILVTIASSGSGLPINTGVVASLIGFMASLAYMTPPSMPYVAISIGSGWTTAKDAFRYGLWLLIISILVATFIAYPLGDLLLNVP